MEDFIRYTLKKGFEYSHQGEQQTAEFIELNAPTAKNIKEVGQIRQALTTAVREHEERSQEEPDEAAPQRDPNEDAPAADPKDIINVIASSSVDLADVYACAKVLLLSKGIAKVGGDEKLTPSLWDSMLAYDVEMMLGTYVANFIMAS